MEKCILIIEDDLQIGNLEQEVLEKAGYTCLRCYSGTEAVLLLEKLVPDQIPLDLNLPGLSGEKLIKQILYFPVIVVSAKTDVDEKVSALLDRAQDYMTKPFSTKELLARVEVQMRKTEGYMIRKIVAGDIVIDDISHSVSVLDHPLTLTRTSYAILKLLVQNQGQVIAKSILLDRISADTPDCTDSSQKTHISHLRTKRRTYSEHEYIVSVWGIGYRFVSE